MISYISKIKLILVYCVIVFEQLYCISCVYLSDIACL